MTTSARSSKIRAAIDGLYARATLGEQHVGIRPYIGARYFEPGVLRVMVAGVNAYVAPTDKPEPGWFRDEFERVRKNEKHADGTRTWLFNRRVEEEVVKVGTALAKLPTFERLQALGLDGAYITNAVKVYLPLAKGLHAADVGDDDLDRHQPIWLEECRLLAEAPPHVILVLGERWWSWAWRTFDDPSSRPTWAGGYQTLIQHRVSIVGVTTPHGPYDMALMRVDHPAARKSRVTAERLVATATFQARFGPATDPTRWRCSICGGIDERGGEFLARYPLAACSTCDVGALNTAGGPCDHDGTFNTGDNPVSIQGKRCWRRYMHGGYVTMLDPEGSPDLATFMVRFRAETLGRP